LALPKLIKVLIIDDAGLLSQFRRLPENLSHDLMKTTSILRLLAMIPLAVTLVSCKLPPRYAMREIQTKGLLNYLGSDYSTVPPQYYASAAPFQLQRPYAEPRPVSPAPYRSTYQTNRNLKAEYNRVPYRPKTVSRSSSSSSKSSAKKSTPSVVKRSEPKLPPSLAASSPAPVKDKPAAEPTKIPAETLPYGAAVSGRPGMVTSPYALKHQLVDVSGLVPGDAVKDPYSGKLFRVPPTQQAADQPKAAAASPAPENKEAAKSETPEEAPAGAAPKP
jgi:hypothetical protein